MVKIGFFYRLLFVFLSLIDWRIVWVKKNELQEEKLFRARNDSTFFTTFAVYLFFCVEFTFLDG